MNDFTANLIHTTDKLRSCKLVMETVAPGPFLYIVIFIIASFFMIWRLKALEKKGFAGTVTGTLIMPYCSGFANLSFAFIMGKTNGNGSLVLENCIVNNVTNLTILLGILSIFWGLKISSNKQGSQGSYEKLNYLSILLTLIAMLFFTGTTWALSRDGILGFNDGLVLTGIFIFWQLLQIIDVLKDNVRNNHHIGISFVVDVALIGICGWATYYSIDHLVDLASAGRHVFFTWKRLGILSGLLMVLPNAFLAFYYTHTGRSDITYSSQIGDSHICIPMCIGLFAIFSPIRIPSFFNLGLLIILGAGITHLFFIAIFRRLPRLIGTILTICYLFFIYKGLTGHS